MIVNGCVSLFDETARHKGVTVEVGIDDTLRIHADRIMIEAIIRNLLSNAIKFSESESVISISAMEKDETIEVEVSDSGIGMTPDQITKVMTNGGYTKRGTANEKGAGIGMTLVREFTAIHKGELSINSKLGDGTRIVVTFPK